MRLAKPFALAALLAVLGFSAPNGEPADGLIFDAMTAPSTVSYTGTVEVVQIGAERSEASVYRIEHRAPNLTKESFTAPVALAGDSVITRGEESFAVDAHRHRVVQSHNDAANDQIALDDNYLLMRANYHAVKRGAESVDGRDCDVVALINRYTNQTTLLVKIDRETKLVLDKQRFGPDGALASEVRFQEVHYVASVPAGDFNVPDFTVVRGPSFGEPSDKIAEVVSRAGFPARNPASLPSGFSPVEGKVAIIKGVRTLQLLYSDGIRTVSLFENADAPSVDLERLHPQPATVGDRSAQYAETGRSTLLVWSDGSLHYALVGELTLRELQHIAASITP